MFSIFGVTVILYFIKILCGNGDSDWTRSNVNAITDEFGLKLWAGCHGVIAVRCLFCNALSKMLHERSYCILPRQSSQQDQSSFSPNPIQVS